MLRQQNNEMFNVVVSRSVYEDADSCSELVVGDSNPPLSLAGQSERSLRVLQQALTNKWSVGLETYYDYLSNKNIHVGVSAMYRDQSAQVHCHVHEQLHAVLVLPARKHVIGE